MKFEIEYITFSFVAFMMCISSIMVPFFGSSLNTTRIYQITLIFLAPFCVIGGITFFRMLIKMIRVSWTDQYMKSSLKILSVFFAIYLLFNSGFVFEIMKENPTSISISQKSIKENGSLKYKTSFFSVVHTFEPDVIGSKWLSKTTSHDALYYMDASDKYALLIYGMVYYSRIGQLSNSTNTLPKGSYSRLGWHSVIQNISVLRTPITKQLIPAYTDTIRTMLERENKIYENGGNNIYLNRGI
jgi:uncharacterized membrane protein